MNNAKISTERFNINLLTIPVLLRTGETITFYPATMGKKNRFVHKLKATDIADVMKEIKDTMINYMETYGISKEITVEDMHLYELFIKLFFSYKVRVRLKKCRDEIASQQFLDALLLKIPWKK